MGEDEPEGWRYTANPQTIWALPEQYRVMAVTEMFRRLARDYSDAVERDDAKAAQKAAAGAIHVVAGLFSDGSDPAHHLIHSIVGAIVAARNGSIENRENSDRHILLRAGARVPGTRAGYGDAHVKGFAVAASMVLRKRGMSKLAARKKVAEILAGLGYSLRQDEEHQPKPVTWSAIRSWEENPEAHPIPAKDAPAMAATIEGDIVKNGLSTIAEIIGLIADHARAFVPRALAY